MADVQDGFQKGRGNQDQIANIHWLLGCTKEFKKTTLCCKDCNKASDHMEHEKLKLIFWAHNE